MAFFQMETEAMNIYQYGKFTSLVIGTEFYIPYI